MTVMEEGPGNMGFVIARRSRRIAFCLSAPLLLVLPLLGGCGSKAANLTFNSDHNGTQYTQQFRQAVFARAEGGEYDLVLVEDGIGAAPRARSHGPLLSSAAAPLSQTVYIRVLWKPLRGSKPDAPSATNSVIDWYVRATDSGDRGDRLHYRGAGFVTIYDYGDEARFVIRNAHLQLTNASDRLQDPLGASSVTGSFLAIRQDELVASQIKLLQEPSAPPAPALPQASAHDGPPPRAPSGP